MPNQMPHASELMMPVTDDHALRQFEIEALRQITDNLKRLNDAQVRLHEGQAKQGEILHSIDNRLIKIESNSVDSRVKLLETKIDSLESDRDKRMGAIGLFEWLFKHWPGLIGFLILVGVVLRANGQLKL